MHAPRHIRLAAQAVSFACGLALVSPAVAQIGQANRPFSAPRITTAPNAAPPPKITVQPWSEVDFGKVSVGRVQTSEVVLMSEQRVNLGGAPSPYAGLSGLAGLGGSGQAPAQAPEPFVRFQIQGGAANDYSVLGEPVWRYVGAAAQGLANYNLIATVQFRPSAEGLRKSGMTIILRDYGSSGRELIGMGGPASTQGAVAIRRPGARAGAMVSLVGNPATLGVSVLLPGVPRAVRMSPEPLSPNAAWETVFPVLGTPQQPVWMQQAVSGGKINGINAADFTLGSEIVLKQGAPATRLITFSPRGSGLRTAEYSQLQFDGSTVVTVLEGYGK